MTSASRRSPRGLAITGYARPRPVRTWIVAAALLAIAGCKRPRPDRKAVSITVTPEQVASAMGVAMPIVRVRMDRTGAEISVGGENVTAGCRGRGPGVAVAAVAGEQDLPSLTRCLETLKATTPSLASQRSIELAPDPSLPYATVIGAMDAVRKSTDGKDLFPDVMFGAPERDR